MEQYLGTARNGMELIELLSKVSSSATLTLSATQYPEPCLEIWYDKELDEVIIK
jgi:hypothetical protein